MHAVVSRAHGRCAGNVPTVCARLYDAPPVLCAPSRRYWQPWKGERQWQCMREQWSMASSRSHQCDHRSREVTIVDHLRVVVHHAGALSMLPHARVMQSGAVGISYEKLVVA